MCCRNLSKTEPLALVDMTFKKGIFHALNQLAKMFSMSMPFH